MTALLRLPSVGAVVHMTAERGRLFRRRTFQPSLSDPDGRHSLLLGSSVLPLPVGCCVLQASWRHRTCPRWHCRSSSVLSVLLCLLYVQRQTSWCRRCTNCDNAWKFQWELWCGHTLARMLLNTNCNALHSTSLKQCVTNACSHAVKF